MGPARPKAIHARTRHVGRRSELAFLSPLVPEPVQRRGVDHKGGHDQLDTGPGGPAELAVGLVVVDGEPDGSDNDDEEAQHEEGDELDLALPSRREHLKDDWQREDEEYEVGHDVCHANHYKLQLCFDARA